MPGQTVPPTAGYHPMAMPFASDVAPTGTPYAANWTTPAHTAPQYQRSGMPSVNALHQPSSTTQYAVPRAGMPVNIANGAFPTEKRGIFVSGLLYKATTKEVKSLFARAGTVTDCEIPLNPATGKSKGNAVVQYASAGEALRAISMFDKMSFKGMKLRVRHDTNMVPVKANGAAQQQSDRSVGTPIIVNGSRVRRPPPDPAAVSFSAVKRAATS